MSLLFEEVTVMGKVRGLASRKRPAKEQATVRTVFFMSVGEITVLF